jgi:hypothetical protein
MSIPPGTTSAGESDPLRTAIGEMAQSKTVRAGGVAAGGVAFGGGGAVWTAWVDRAVRVSASP